MSITVTQTLKVETLELLDKYQRAFLASQHSPSEYNKTQVIRIRNQVVKSNIGLVRKEVHHWLSQCQENYDDLFQVGCLGLIRAIERFDATKGSSFSSFAVPYIKGEIQHYLRDKSPLVKMPRQWVVQQKQAEDFEKSYVVKYNRNPGDDDVARALGLSVEAWREIKLAGKNRSPVSLDYPAPDEDDGGTPLGEVVPDYKYRSFQLAQEDQLRLEQGLAKLEEQTRKVLEFVFLYDLTQKQTAERLGVSTVTVSRRVKKGLDALRSMLTE